MFHLLWYYCIADSHLISCQYYPLSLYVTVFQIFPPTESVCLINVFLDDWTWGKKSTFNLILLSARNLFDDP